MTDDKYDDDDDDYKKGKGMKKGKCGCDGQRRMDKDKGKNRICFSSMPYIIFDIYLIHHYLLCDFWLQ